MELTGKQRATLRSMCNRLESIVSIGKDGITQAVKDQLAEALEKREIVKCTVQQNAPLTAKEAMEEVCAALYAEPVQTIGRRFTVYKRSRKNPKIEL